MHFPVLTNTFQPIYLYVLKLSLDFVSLKIWNKTKLFFVPEHCCFIQRFLKTKTEEYYHACKNYRNLWSCSLQRTIWCNEHHNECSIVYFHTETYLKVTHASKEQQQKPTTANAIQISTIVTAACWFLLLLNLWNNPDFDSNPLLIVQFSCPIVMLIVSSIIRLWISSFYNYQTIS